MKKTIVALIVFCGLFVAGCSVLIGKDDTSVQKGLSLRFVETLRNEASLRGEGLKEASFKTDHATTLQQPNSVFADAFRVYVTDTAPARIFVFDRGERTVTVLDNSLVGTPPTPKDDVKLIAPGGITVDAAGTLWVSDSQQGRVFGYTKNGKSLFVIGKFGELAMPVGLAADYRRNRLYVADAHAHQVKVFASDGTRLFEIGASGASGEDFRFPGAIAFDRNENLYVLDTQRRLVQKIGPDGKFLKTFGLSGATHGSAVKPKGIAVDSSGHLYVTDSISNNVLVFDQEGEFLFTWGRTGILSGEFWTPAGIFIDERDYVYIADQTNGRVQVFQYSR